MAEPLIKKRKIAVLDIKDQFNVNKIKGHLRKEEGIIALNVDEARGRLVVEYDLWKINFEKIEKSLEELGFSLSRKIFERIKRGMAKFTEQNELDNLKAKPSSCCENPRGMSQKMDHH